MKILKSKVSNQQVRINDRGFYVLSNDEKFRLKTFEFDEEALIFMDGKILNSAK